MQRFMFVTSVVFISMSLSSGCNIVPKRVQYQKEEEKLIGGTDTISPIVEEIQMTLYSLGYKVGTKDGRMGQDTRDAIKEFQESIGIKSTGYIDKFTLTQIEDIRRANDERELKKQHTIEVRSAYSDRKDYDSTGVMHTTKDIQTALKKAGFDPGPIDGKIGPKTKQAIKEFQRAKGLVVDGKVGPKTWSELGGYLR